MSLNSSRTFGRTAFRNRSTALRGGEVGDGKIGSDSSVLQSGEVGDGKISSDRCAILCCIDLSSPHATFTADPNDTILHVNFANGYAAAVLRAKAKASTSHSTLAIYDDNACLVEGSEDSITLAVKENGITCRLSE